MAGHPNPVETQECPPKTPLWGDYVATPLYEALAIWADTFVLVNVFLTLTDL